MKKKKLILKYLISIVVCAAALFLKLKLRDYTSSSSAALFYIAVSLSAVLGGTGPGILSVFLCSLAHLYYFVPPDNSFELASLDDTLQFILFLFASNLICFLIVALQKARAVAMQLAREKTMFAANVSHELRTPLNAIVGLTNLLLNTQQTSEQKQFTELIQQSSKSLSKLVNDILDFSKLEMNRASVESEDFNLHEQILQCTQLIQTALKNKDLILNYKIDSQVPAFLKGDAGKLGQIILNLLNNAVKFTDRGSITLEVNSELLSNEKLKLSVTVADTGIGISPDQQEKIFEAFVQLDSHSDSKNTGAGLGLAICKQLAKSMAGDIKVESQLGRGSKFSFYVILEKSHNIELGYMGDSSVPQFVKHASRPHVLVVDDNNINQMVLVKTLELMGCQVDSVSNGKEAIKQISDIKYDIVFMDCQMPEMDGYEASSIIRDKGGAFRDIPIIALTAYASIDNKKKCLSAGMSDYIAKPVQVTELALLFQKWLSYKFPLMQADSLDKQYLDSIEDQTLRQVADVFFDNTPPRLALLDLAIEKRDFENIEKLAHYLKSSSSVVGAVKMSRFCHELETLGSKKNLESISTAKQILERVSDEYVKVKVRLRELIQL